MTDSEKKIKSLELLISDLISDYEKDKIKTTKFAQRSGMTYQEFVENSVNPLRDELNELKLNAL